VGRAADRVTILLVFVIITLIMLVLLVADQSFSKATIETDGPLGSLTSQVGLGNNKLGREIRAYRNPRGVPDPTGEVC
jgi:hypothetical protein